jgi:hypothetical protein
MSSPARSEALPPDLERLSSEFEKSMATVRDLLNGTSEENLRKRPAPHSWSPLECVAHLNLSNEAMLPGIQGAVHAAQPASGRGTYRMDLAGRLLAWSLEPPARIKMKASASAKPIESVGRQEVLDGFVRQHEELLRLLRASLGRAIDREKVKSPFANLRYNAYSAFRIVAAHDRRHLWQARRAFGG